MGALRLLLCLALLVCAAGARAQDPFNIHMILWRGETEVEDGFRAYMARRGLPVDITVHNINRDRSLLPGIIEKVRAEAPDLVYTWGTSIALAVAGRQGEADPAVNITDIPVLHTLVSYPVGVSLVPEDRLTRRNNTAVSHVPPIPAQVQAMRSFRELDRIGVIYNPQEPNSLVNITGLRAAADAQGIEVLEAPVQAESGSDPDPAQLPALIAQLAEAGADFLYIGPDNFVGEHSVFITEEAIAHDLPAFTATELEVRDASALFGLVSRYEAVGELTALQAERILVDGISPGDIPAQTLEKFTFLIRQDVMHRIQLYPPMQILRYAVVVQ